MSDHQMTEKVWNGLQARGCSNAECPTTIKLGDSYFRDGVRGVGCCLPCGQRLRYHRKKALERGETIPATLADVEARHVAAGV